MKTEIYGNVMSLLKGKDNLESATALEAKNAFYGLFAGAEKLVNSAERQLVLPATTLTEGCYQDMFNGCKGIEKAPELPAPKLEKNCYQEMFYDCAKLNHVKCLATDIKAENSIFDRWTKEEKETYIELTRKFLEMMRTEAETSSIPVMFLTGRSDRVSIQRVMSLHPADYLLKTIEKPALLEKLHAFFEKQESEHPEANS